ncbi:MAG: preprotein translocase subunit YajC [Firmicutes bacterium]|nr:preprotein translocase subunit YajC [Bacillota bacterium]MDY5586026.1 preprotein translocase subunit YajC [Eubacteriales bacterium]
MNFLAAEAAANGNATQWILPAILLVLVIGIFLLNYFRSKKNQESMKNMVDSLKVGDNVKTYSGIYGKIIEIVETTDGKVAVLETGSEKNKGIFSIDINAIYGIDEKKPVVYDANGNVVSEEEPKEGEKAEEIKEDLNNQQETEKPKKRGKKAKKEEPVVEAQTEPLKEETAAIEQEQSVEETKEEPAAEEVKEEKPKRKSKKQ